MKPSVQSKPGFKTKRAPIVTGTFQNVQETDDLEEPMDSSLAVINVTRNREVEIFSGINGSNHAEDNDMMFMRPVKQAPKPEE